jgi:regulatory protein
MATRPPISLRNRALAYLATREHSRAELTRKLATRTTAAVRRERQDAAASTVGDEAADLETRDGTDRAAETSAETAAAIETLLDELQARGLLCEQRYVASVLHRRATRLGAARIRQELRAKGVPDAAMRDSLQGLAESEETRAREVWQRRFDSPPGDAREHARQGRFLLARGFSAEIVQRILRRPQVDLSDSGHDGTGDD